MIRLAVVVLGIALVVASADATRVHDGRIRAPSCIIWPESDAVTTETSESTRRGCETTVTAPVAMDGPWISAC